MWSCNSSGGLDAFGGHQRVQRDGRKGLDQLRPGRAGDAPAKLPHADGFRPGAQRFGHRSGAAVGFDDVTMGRHDETLQTVAFARNLFLTPCDAGLITVRDMHDWLSLRDPHERIRWARLNRTHFVRPTDAARSLGVKPGTYRTWEIAKADGGRAPMLSELQHLARKNV